MREDAVVAPPTKKERAIRQSLKSGESVADVAQTIGVPTVVVQQIAGSKAMRRAILDTRLLTDPVAKAQERLEREIESNINVAVEIRDGVYEPKDRLSATKLLLDKTHRMSPDAPTGEQTTAPINLLIQVLTGK